MNNFSWMKRADPSFWKIPIVIGYMILVFFWAVSTKSSARNIWSIVRDPRVAFWLGLGISSIAFGAYLAYRLKQLQECLALVSLPLYLWGGIGISLSVGNLFDGSPASDWTGPLIAAGFLLGLAVLLHRPRFR